MFEFALNLGQPLTSPNNGNANGAVYAIGGFDAEGVPQESMLWAVPDTTTGDFDDWQRLIDFNLNATFLFLNAVVPVMKRAGGGKIVSISSIAGRGLSALSSSAYATAKGGIMAITATSGPSVAWTCGMVPMAVRSARAVAAAMPRAASIT